MIKISLTSLGLFLLALPLMQGCMKPKPYIASLAVVKEVQPERIVIPADGGCSLCHSVFAKRTYYKYYPVSISHKTHTDLGVECTFCHRKASLSRETADFLMPEGHTFGNETALSPVADENPCRTCHLYSSKSGRNDKKMKAQCRTCHDSYSESKPLRGAPLAYVTTLKMNHRIHYERGLPCLRCHVNFDTLEKPVYTFIPKRDLCTECHSAKGGVGPTGGVKRGGEKSGRELFQTNCTPCHGEEGRGDGPVSAFFSADLKPGDLSDPARMARRTDEQLFDIIYYGGPELTLSERMPAWIGLLSREEVKRLVKYVRTLSVDERSSR